MKNEKTQKGITLIALIITIVVLLILAVVAIGSVQESGIIGHAQNAASTYNQAKANEIDALAGYETLIEDSLKEEQTIKGKTLNTNLSEFSEALSKVGSNDLGGDKYYISYVSGNSNIYIIIKSGNSFYNYSVVYVTYTDENGNSSKYAVCNSQNAWSLEQFKSSATSYPYIPSGSWAKLTGEYYENDWGEVQPTAEIYEPINEIPEFLGNWEIDESKTSEEGKRLLSNVLIDVIE